MKKILTATLLAGALIGGQAYANSSVFCDRQAALSAEQKNQILNFSTAVKDVLKKSGHDAAIISRSGTDLERFHIRYSHAGITLKKSENTEWSVRQLYYGCEEEKPSIFDQGLAGFLMTRDDKLPSYVSMLFLPAPQEQQLEQTALNKQTALQLLGPSYSANAYAFSTAFQNCNQWLMELLAYAWGGIQTDSDFRSKAQQWLKANQYEPTAIDVKHRYVIWAGYFVPLIHASDHPPKNVGKNIFEVSMPASIEQFVKQRIANTERVEMCLKDNRIVIHRGWTPIADGCVAGPDDEVLSAS